MAVRGRSHRAAQVNLGAMVLLVIVIALLAAHVSPQPPPQIAEFNPSEQQIKEPPPNQAPSVGGAGNGQGLGGNGPAGFGSPNALPTPVQQAIRAIELNKIKHCVRERQTEDPQSPPCVNYFGGANPGATYRGVTATQITVAVPLGDNTDQGLQDMEKYFNSRFEFYGRSLHLVAYNPTPQQRARSGELVAAEDPPDPTSESEDADHIAQLGAFADVGYADQTGDASVFYETLARRYGILGIDSTASVMTEADYDQYAPYMWDYYPAGDTTQRNLAAWVCNRLHGFTAKYTGGSLARATRKFGLLVGDNPTKQTDVSVLIDGLGACGIQQGKSGSDGLVVSRIQIDANDSAFTNSVAAMQQPGDPVTSVICYCKGGTLNDNILHRWQNAADNQSYFPEYVVNHFLGTDNDAFLLFTPPCDQKLNVFCSSNNRDHTFGISAQTKWDGYLGATMPCGYTTKEVDPSSGIPAEACNDVESAGGQATGITWGYQGMLLLASGIQLAGPNLTPQTFQAGLFKAQFENPSCDGPPLYQSCVGFGPDDHTMSDSYVEEWASSKDRTDDESTQFQATYCYGEATNPHGVRYRLPRPNEAPGRNWPSGDTLYFFGEPCH